jgi:ankyrin repeat protein
MAAAAGGHEGCVRAILGATGVCVDRTAAHERAGGDSDESEDEDEENQPEEHEWTALLYAADSEPCTRALIAAGADVNHQEGALGCTPLYRAAECGNVACVTALVAAGAYHHVNGILGPPLIAASERGNLDCVAALLSAGARATAENRSGCTALHRACTGECAQALINAGARVDTRDEDGRTPLHIAVFIGRLDTVRVLLRAGSDINAANHQGNTPMTDVADHFDYDAVVQVMLDAGADVQLRNNQGCTALWKACIEGNERSARALINAGADIEARGHLEMEEGVYSTFTLTPLMAAARFDQLNCVKALLQAGADVCALNEEGRCALSMTRACRIRSLIRAAIVAQRCNQRWTTHAVWSYYAKCWVLFIKKIKHIVVANRDYAPATVTPCVTPRANWGTTH